MHNDRPTNDTRQSDDRIDVFENGSPPPTGGNVAEISPVSLRRVRITVRHVDSAGICEMSAGGCGVRRGEVAVGMDVDAVRAWREEVKEIG